jgi:hypothetical protein
VRRSPKGEFFVFVPRIDPREDIHTSYHLDGRVHLKSEGERVFRPDQRQALTGLFRGIESLGMFKGFGPKSIGAICDPTAFSGVVELGPDILGPREGQISVALVEPGYQPLPVGTFVEQKVFTETAPWVMITVEQ